jgi:hypothetical protein
MGGRGSHRWVRQRGDPHSRQDNVCRVPWCSRGTRGRDVSPTLAQCNDRMYFSHYYSGLWFIRRQSRRSGCLNTARRGSPEDKGLRQFFANVVASSSLAPDKLLLGNPAAQTRRRKRRCELGARPAQLPALTCASTGGCRLTSSSAPRVGEDLVGHFRRGRLPGRRGRGYSVGGGILRPSRLCSRA